MKIIEKSAINITPEGIVISGVESETEVVKHTEEIQEIITKVPSWVVRWGITSVFGIFLIAVAISVIVRYPDMVKVPLKLQSSVGLTAIIATTPGKIVKVFVKKDEIVEKGQPLLKIQSLTDGNAYDTLKSPQTGKIGLSVIVQSGINVAADQQIFQLHPLNEQFFGVITISQNSISKIKEGQDVLISFSNLPEGYSPLKGKVEYIANEPLKGGLFVAKVAFDNNVIKDKNIHLKNWMTGEAQIVTEDVSLQSRLLNSIVKGIK